MWLRSTAEQRHHYKAGWARSLRHWERQAQRQWSPLRDAVEKYLRGAVADALLAEIGIRRGAFVVCGDELILRLIQVPTPDCVIAG
jgi:hypothetical protein